MVEYVESTGRKIPSNQFSNGFLEPPFRCKMKMTTRVQLSSLSYLETCILTQFFSTKKLFDDYITIQHAKATD